MEKTNKAEEFKKQNAGEKATQERETADGKKEYLDEVTNEWVGKNELKKRQTQRKKAQQAAEKAAAKKAKEGEAGEKKPKKGAPADDEGDLDPSQYTEMRKKFLEAQRKEGKNPYPHKFQRDMTIPQFREKFEQVALENGQFVEDQTIAVTGRIMGLRNQGAKLIFIDLQEDEKKVQVFATAANYTGDFDFLHRTLRYGDIIGIVGNPGKTKTGELSIRPTKIECLSYCLHQLPRQAEGTNVLNKDTRYRQRYLDLIMNNSTKNIFKVRNQVVDFIRKYLRDMDFIEVETPMMNMIPGGATARPFETFHHDLDMKLYMRIAPELYLKMLIVGGMNRVFEIGKQFRNEGIDMTHNPEFTTCEFYWAYADYNDLMEMTEDMLSKMVYAIHGKHKIAYHPNGQEDKDNVIEIDFTPPFRRIPMMKGLEEALGMKMPDNTKLDTPESNKFFDKLCKDNEVECSNPRTTARLIDKLVGHFLESQCKNPTFIIDTPAMMSPLAKWHRSEPGLSERFELFCNYHEIINAYTELNDPKVQLAAFQGQAAAKDAGDLEAQHVDQSFVTALEYGLPPTAGWGCGVDRITMLLTDTNNIKEVMLFPAMKPNTGAKVQDDAATNEPVKVYSTEKDQYLAKIVGSLSKATVEVVQTTKADAFKNKDLAKKHPFMSFPYLETASGDIVAEETAIACHLARANKAAGLFGTSPFQEAKVHDWIAWADKTKTLVEEVTSGIRGNTKTVDLKKYDEDLKTLKEEAKFVNSALKGKKFLVGDKLTLADVVVGWSLTTAFQLCFDAGFRKSISDLNKWFEAFTKLPEVVQAAGNIKSCAVALKPPGAKEEKAEAEDDDDLDLFGDEDEGDAEAAKKAAAAAKEKAQGGAKKKKVVTAMSLVMLEVKPLDDTTNLDDLAQQIFSTITQEGLYWKTEYKKEPVAFGIFKLIVGFSLEDEKVSVDGVVERIEGIEDKVQSVEIAVFNKI